MAVSSASGSLLPACTDFSSVTNPAAYCAPCYFHADSTIHPFPHSLQTVNIDVIPFVATLGNGARTTSYSTLTPLSSAPRGKTFTASSELTWVLDGITLTAPTTYVDYDDMYGTGLKTTFADGTHLCADPRRVTELRTPTIDKASMILPLPSASSAVSNKSLPVQVEDYLKGLAWFERQMKDNHVSTCLPTTAEFVTSITCTLDPISEIPVPLTTTTCFATSVSGSVVTTCATGVYGFTLTPVSTILPATTTSIPILTSLTESPYPTTVDTKGSATWVNFQTRPPEPLPIQSQSASASVTASIQPTTVTESSSTVQSASGSTTTEVTTTVVIQSSSSIADGKTTVDLRVSGPAVTISGTVYTAIPSASTGVGSYIMCGVSTCPNNNTSVAPATSSMYVVPSAQSGSSRSVNANSAFSLLATVVAGLAIIL